MSKLFRNVPYYKNATQMWRINKPILTAYNNMNKPSLHCVLYYTYTSTWSPITEDERRQRWHIVVKCKETKKKLCRFVQRFIKFPFSSPERDGRIVLSLLLNFAFQGSFPIIFFLKMYICLQSKIFFYCQGSLYLSFLFNHTYGASSRKVIWEKHIKGYTQK